MTLNDWIDAGQERPEPDLREVRVQILMGNPIKYQVVDHATNEVLMVLRHLYEFDAVCLEYGWTKHKEQDLHS